MLKNQAVFYLKGKNLHLIILISILALSGFTHLWNPVGFPSIHPDEGTYIRRALAVLEGQGPQESPSYFDHPYFGQLFLASVFSLLNYPESLNSSTDIQSVEGLYFVPRVIMGVLGIFDTFLIYKIAESRYGRKTAIIASILFAVMPVSWLTRRIFLDSLLLPFLLSSILLAISVAKAKMENKNVLIFFSGIMLGLTIFTKIPAFTMIPLVTYLIFRNNQKKKLSILLLFGPILFIPLLWPGYALLTDNFDEWAEGILFQTGRAKSIELSIRTIFEIDPVTVVLGLMGFVYGVIKRDWLILFWAIPFLIFLYFIGYVSWFHWLPMVPLLCIIGGRLIGDLSKLARRSSVRIRNMIPYIVLLDIAIFGLITTGILITTDISSPTIEAISYALQNLENQTQKGITNEITIVSGPHYSWIFKHVFHYEPVFDNYRENTLISTQKILLIADNQFRKYQTQDNLKDDPRMIRLSYHQENTNTIETFDAEKRNYPKVFPYLSFRLNNPQTPIEINTNYQGSSIVDQDITIENPETVIINTVDTKSETIVKEKLEPIISGGECFRPGEIIKMSSWQSKGDIYDRNWVISDESGKNILYFNEKPIAEFSINEPGKYLLELSINNKEKETAQNTTYIIIDNRCTK